MRRCSGDGTLLLVPAADTRYAKGIRKGFLCSFCGHCTVKRTRVLLGRQWATRWHCLQAGCGAVWDQPLDEPLLRASTPEDFEPVKLKGSVSQLLDWVRGPRS